MPSKTFLGLPSDKKAKIISAARAAFSDAPYSEVTVADIIRLAEIPRGSFYQYFKDKDDIYFYLLETFREKFKTSFLSDLQQHDGDLFAALQATYDDITDYLTHGIDQRLIKNIFMEMDYRGYQHLLKSGGPPAARHHKPDWLQWQQDIRDNTDLSKLRISDDQFGLLLHMLFGFMGQSLAHHILQSPEEAQQASTIHAANKFSELLNWSEYGVLKETTGRESND